MSDQLDGRRVLVTGATSGIGAATAHAVAAAGGRVALLARRRGPLEELVAEFDGVAVPADVTDLDAMRTAVDTAVAALDGLDAVVNAAGVMRPGTVGEGDPADFRLMLDVNVLGLLHATHLCLPHLRRADHGDIVNLSSMSGRRVPSGTGGVYAGTKFAVHAISQGLRLELADDAVRVTTIAPGFVDTPIFTGVAGEVAARYRESAASEGMAPAVVADLVVTALAAPPEVELVELAVVSTVQGAG